MPRGRKSTKKDRLYLVYKTLRCTMDDEDVDSLISLYPKFEELTEESRDIDIIEACCRISEAMEVVFQSDMDSDGVSQVRRRMI